MEGYSSSHIKTEGSQLWKLLSTALGEKVSKKSFRAALERRLKSNEGDTAAPSPVLAAFSPKPGKVEIEALKAISRFEAENPFVDYSVDNLTADLKIDEGEGDKILKQLRRLGLVKSIWDDLPLFPNLNRPLNETRPGRLSEAGHDFLRDINNSAVM